MNHALLGSAGLLLLAIVSAPVAPPACARPVAGIEMPDTIRVERELLQLNGVALYRKLGARVLVAGLWLEHGEHDAEEILRDDSPRRYVTHFLHGVSSKRICAAWRDGLEANSPNASAEVKEQFRTLCSWIHDFHSGDEIAVTYLPGRGCLVDVHGVRVGAIPGKAFSDAYFACAIGRRPGLGTHFKSGLLGTR
jgi:hypothetical protein